MSNDPIVITKENDGDTINFFEESSDDSEIQLQRRPVLRSRHRSAPTAKSTSRVRTQRPPSVPSAPSAVPAPPTLNDNLFEVFTNPDKKRHEDPEDPEEDPDASGYDEDEYAEPGFFPQQHEYEEEQPSAGFASIQDEKQDLLYKFYRLTSKGIPVGKKFTMNSDIHEMRHEFNRIQRDHDVKSSIRFSRRMLMACVTGIEFLNKRYDPFDIKLEGWSESVMENMDDYDNVFERLHDKYASRVSMAPEIELLLSLAGSAFMFHLTNSMFNSMPNLKDIAKQNPDILKNLMQSIHNMAPSAAAAAAEPAPEEKSVFPDPNKPREMKPPAIDMSSLLGNLPIGNATFPVGNATFPVATRGTPPPPPPPKPALKPALPTLSALSGSSLSSLSGMSALNKKEPDDIMKIVSIDTSQVSKSTRGRRKNKITSTKENTISI